MPGKRHEYEKASNNPPPRKRRKTFVEKQPATIVYEKSKEIEKEDKAKDVYETAKVFYKNTNYAEAISMLEQFLADATNSTTIRTDCHLFCHSLLGICYTESGHAARAIKILEDCLQQYINHFGLEHSSTLIVYYNYGDALAQNKQIELAQMVLETCLKVWQRTTKEWVRLSFMKKMMHTLCDCMINQGLYKKVLELCREYLAAMITTFGADHDETLAVQLIISTSVNPLFTIKGHEAVKKEVLQLTRDGFERSTAVLGSMHATTLFFQHNFAVALYFTSDYKSAREVNQSCLDRRRIVLGAEDEKTLATQNNLAYTLKHLQHTEEAVLLAEDFLEKCTRACLLNTINVTPITKLLKKLRDKPRQRCESYGFQPFRVTLVENEYHQQPTANQQSTTNNTQQQQLFCAILREEIAPGMEACKWPGCGHVFSFYALYDYLKGWSTRKTCPLCRHEF